MRVAFLFKEEYPNYNALCKVFENIGVEKLDGYQSYIRAGLWGFLNVPEKNVMKRRNLISAIVLPFKGGYFQMTNEDSLNILATENIYVVQIDCIKRNLIEKTHNNLKSYKHYLGFTQVFLETKVHLSVFDSVLPYVAKIEDKKIKLLYNEFSDEEWLSDEIMTWIKEKYGLLSIFVDKKNIGMKFSIFDSNENSDSSYNTAKVLRILKDECEFRSEEVLYKLKDIAPQAFEELITAIISLEKNNNTPAECAQIAANFRRCFEKLADVLMPATSNKQKDKYKDRLKKYVNKRLIKSKLYQEYLSIEIDEIGTRIEKAFNMGNKGIHEDWLCSAFSKLAIRIIILINDLIMDLKVKKSSIYYEAAVFEEQ